jgi:hypothetical protein
MLQELSNDIKNVTRHWGLTLAIALWNFGSPPRLHLPKWELPWECEGSLPHTPSHFLTLPKVFDVTPGLLLALIPGLSLALTPGLTLGLTPGLPLGLTPGLSLGPQPYNPFALVASPKLGLRHPCYCLCQRNLSKIYMLLSKLKKPLSKTIFISHHVMCSSIRTILVAC